jgi:hypothetical protein
MSTFRTISCAALIILTGAVNGQGLDDALLFSRQHMHGSARFNSMGGAFTALGGDMGAIHLNPASTGVFTKNELGITLGVGSTGVHSGYYGTPVSANYGKLNANSLGIVFSSEMNHPDWKAINVGITYARTHDFNERMSYRGTQSEHSFGGHIANQASSFGLPGEDLGNADPFLVHPAYSAFIIDDVPNMDNVFYSPVENSESVNQQFDRQRDGRGSEWMLSLGTNYKDRLYFGFGLHVNTMVLTERIDHIETPENNTMISRHSYRADYELRGTGYSLSGGVIGRISNMFRVGASIQTPHFYVNNEVFSTTMRATLLGEYAQYAADFNMNNPTVATSPQGSFRYNFNTPWRFTGGVAAVFGPRAILSAEYEYKDFSTSRFGRNNRSASSYDFGFENDDINLVLGQTHNVRAGFEYRILPFSLRAGYAFYQNPVNSDFRGDTDRNIHQMSVGAGVRFNKIYFDAGYFYRMSNSRYRLYDTGFNDAASLAIAQHGFSVTFGIRY